MFTKKKQRQSTSWLALLALLAVLAGCQQTPEPTATVQAIDPNVVRTAAAQTADARLEAIPSPTPNPPTLSPAEWTQTAEAQVSPTASLTPTLDPSQPITVTVTPTVATSPTVTLAPAGADNAAYVKDVNIPDNTAIDAGAKFTKTWQFLNSGSTNWTTEYELVWVDGDQMGATASAKIPVAVPAGQTVDISVELTAPSADGTYKGFWRMRNPSGQFFGDAVYVQIKVGAGGSTAQPTETSAIGALSVTVNNATVTAECPYTFVVSANLEIKEAATVSYQLEAGGFALTLPSPRTESLGAGNYTFTYELEISEGGTGWARLHVTSPADITSNEVSFSLTCNP